MFLVSVRSSFLKQSLSSFLSLRVSFQFLSARVPHVRCVRGFEVDFFFSVLSLLSWVGWWVPFCFLFRETPGENVGTFSPDYPFGSTASVDSPQDNPTHPVCSRACSRRSRTRRPRVRTCLRKGCGCRYQPRCWNQRYCQDTECQRQVRRWQAAQRQARRRRDATVQAEHAQAERVRRQRIKDSPEPPDKPDVAAERGHAAKVFLRRRCATVRDAMNGPKHRLATRLGIAALPVGKRCTTFEIANASGGLVTR